MSDLSPKTIFEETLPKKFEDHPENVEGFEAIYLFDIAGDDGGKWTLVCDGSKAIIEVGEPDEAMCTISMDDTDFVDMMKGDLNPMMAFSVGKLRVAGDIGLAIKIQAILG